MSEQLNTSTKLSQSINAYLDELAQLTDQARVSEAMQAYLDTCARFHRYSMRNMLLILFARPDATQVAGYKTWQQLKRQVRKGEHGIPVLAPMVMRVDDQNPERQVLLRFKVVHVFDVSQTEGEPLPPTPDWKNPEKNEQLQQGLLAFAGLNGIQVTVEALEGDTQGVSKGGSIVLNLEAGTKTLIHEIAHELMHQDRAERPASREAREAEAESVAYVVGRHFGLGGLQSPNYLALWHADSKVLREHMERIVECSRRIITAVEAQPAQGEEVPA